MSSVAGAARSDWSYDWRALAERHRWLAPAVPAGIALVLGLITIGSKSFWMDEAFSVNAARLPTNELLPFLWRGELHGSPYYLALHVWSALGTSEGVLRALSVVFGVIGVLATYFVGQRYRVGFVAALILSVAAFFIQFEQEARAYTLLVAWSAVSTLCFLRFEEAPSRVRALIYGLSGALMIYVHPLGALIIVAHAMWALVARQPAWRLLLITYVGIGIAWLPMLRFTMSHTDRIGWIEPLTLASATDHLVTLGGGFAAAIVLAALLIMGMRRDLLALWLLVPIAGTILISLLVQPTMQAKYLIGVLPAAAIIAARARPALIALLLVVSLVGVGSWYVNGVKDDWRAGVAWIQAQAQPTDGLIFSPSWERQPFEYYGEIGTPLYPSIPWEGVYISSMGLNIDPPAGAAPARVWVVEDKSQPSAPAEVMRLIDGYVEQVSADFGVFGGPQIRLMARP